MRAGEKSIFGTAAAVYESDGDGWVQRGDALNRTDIVKGVDVTPSYLIVAKNSHGNDFIRFCLYPECDFTRASGQFCHLTGEDESSIGLSFASSDEADSFTQVIKTLTLELRRHRDIAVKQSKQTVPSADTHDVDKARATKAAPLDHVRDSHQSSKPLPHRGAFLPTPTKSISLIPNGGRELNASSDEFWRVESLLEFCLSSADRQHLKIDSIRELVDESNGGIDSFATTFSGFNVTDLWCYLSDLNVVQSVCAHGFKSIAEQGIHVGRFTKSLAGVSVPALILCKVAVGRSMPLTKAALDSSVSITVPPGYHSLYIRDNDTQDIGGGLDFYDNFYIYNAAQIVPIAVVSFTVQPILSANNPKLEALEYVKLKRAQIRQAFDANSFGGRNADSVESAFREDFSSSALPVSVDDDFAELQREIGYLGEQKTEMVMLARDVDSSLMEFRDTICARSGVFRQEAVDCLRQHLRNLQMVEDHKFELARLISEMERLQEFFHYKSKVVSKILLMSLWKQFDTMRSNLELRARMLMELTAPGSQFALALAERNLKLLRLQNETDYRDRAIRCLRDRLMDHGALKPEDEDLMNSL